MTDSLTDSRLLAPFAGWWTCPDCGRDWPIDLEVQATPVCSCDLDTVANYARRDVDG